MFLKNDFPDVVEEHGVSLMQSDSLHVWQVEWIGQTHACMKLGPAHTAHLLVSFLGHIPCASSWLLFSWPGCCELPGSVPQYVTPWQMSSVSSDMERGLAEHRSRSTSPLQ